MSKRWRMRTGAMAAFLAVVASTNIARPDNLPMLKHCQAVPRYDTPEMGITSPAHIDVPQEYGFTDHCPPYRSYATETSQRPFQLKGFAKLPLYHGQQDEINRMWIDFWHENLVDHYEMCNNAGTVQCGGSDITFDWTFDSSRVAAAGPYGVVVHLKTVLGNEGSTIVTKGYYPLTIWVT